VSDARCDRGWEVEAYREGRLGTKDVESYERHLRTCAVCAERVARDERLQALGRALPVAEPAELALRRLRARILRDVTTRAPGRPWLTRQRLAFVSALGIALVAIASVVAVRSAARTHATAASARAGPPARLAGAVAPGAGAAWTQTREGTVERVELEAGTLRVHVRPQGAGERFLVRLPDGEIEVRGTTFEVTALAGLTRHVGVDEGTVVLRLRGSPDRSLGPGTSWSAPESAPSDGQQAMALPAATARAATLPRRHDGAAQDKDYGASVYVSAMQSFREGRYDSAAAAFHAFALAFPQATEAEDASFLEALSLARAGRGDAAALAAQRHLESFPRSFRRKEASILVARAASHRGRCDEAIGVLAPWIGASPDVDIQSVLAACGSRAAER
jgi:TolA-binding protein